MHSTELTSAAATNDQANKEFDFTICHYCKTTGLDTQEKYCPNCRFPQGGTLNEQKGFYVQLKIKKGNLADKKKSIRKAKIILFVLGGLNIAAGLSLGLIIRVDINVLITTFIIGSIYLSLGFWANKKPFQAILIGFFVYISTVTMSGVIDPSTLYKGLLWKGLIIAGFIYGIRAVKDAKAIEEELIESKSGIDLNA
ncbi:MAG: hypothetical protein ACI9XP_001309 [Lentimonas sp.]|jgi:hypothetical protein